MRMGSRIVVGDDVLELFGWLSHAALIRPVPVPEWDAP